MIWINPAPLRAISGQFRRESPFSGPTGPTDLQAGQPTCASPDPPDRRLARIAKPAVIYYHRVNGNM
jgi:hypothetical protein